MTLRGRGHLPTLKHFDDYGTARFITFSCFRRYRLLTNEPVIKVFLEELRSICDSHSIRLLGYVIMPNHVHLVLYPPQGVSLGRVIGELKSKSARRILPLLNKMNGFRTDRLRSIRSGEEKQMLWQKRCYDHNCRTPETVTEKIEYCHKNPVSAGLVSGPADWQWSSFRWYEGGGDGPIEIDDFPV